MQTLAKDRWVASQVVPNSRPRRNGPMPWLQPWCERFGPAGGNPASLSVCQTRVLKSGSLCAQGRAGVAENQSSKEKRPRQSPNALILLARPAGVEPATYGLEGQGCCNNGKQRAQIAAYKTMPCAPGTLPDISRFLPFFAPQCPMSAPRDSSRFSTVCLSVPRPQCPACPWRLFIGFFNRWGVIHGAGSANRPRCVHVALLALGGIGYRRPR